VEVIVQCKGPGKRGGGFFGKGGLGGDICIIRLSWKKGQVCVASQQKRSAEGETPESDLKKIRKEKIHAILGRSSIETPSRPPKRPVTKGEREGEWKKGNGVSRQFCRGELAQ